MARYIVVYFTK